MTARSSASARASSHRAEHAQVLRVHSGRWRCRPSRVGVFAGAVTTVVSLGQPTADEYGTDWRSTTRARVIHDVSPTRSRTDAPMDRRSSSASLESRRTRHPLAGSGGGRYPANQGQVAIARPAPRPRLVVGLDAELAEHDGAQPGGSLREESDSVRLPRHFRPGAVAHGACGLLAHPGGPAESRLWRSIGPGRGACFPCRRRLACPVTPRPGRGSACASGRTAGSPGQAASTRRWPEPEGDRDLGPEVVPPDRSSDRTGFERVQRARQAS
jgi:hypothetical protein